MSEFSAQRRHDAASKETIMTKRSRQNHRPSFKAKVVVAAIKGEKTLTEPAQDFDVRPNQIRSNAHLCFAIQLLPKQKGTR
jgi:transposase-like protein